METRTCGNRSVASNGVPSVNRSKPLVPGFSSTPSLRSVKNSKAAKVCAHSFCVAV